MRARTSVVLLVVIAACAEQPSPSPPADLSTPVVASVRCEADGTTEILTPTVQAQPDGVHIDVQVRTGVDLAFIVADCCGFNAEDGPFVVSSPPGRMRVACLRARDQDAGDDSLYREIEVVDERSAYVPFELSCRDAQGVGSGDPGPSAGPDPISAARALLTGLRPGDELVQVGYVERGSGAVVGVRRDGEFVAGLSLEPSGGGWGWIGFESCPDSGVSY